MLFLQATLLKDVGGDGNPLGLVLENHKGQRANPHDQHWKAIEDMVAQLLEKVYPFQRGDNLVELY